MIQTKRLFSVCLLVTALAATMTACNNGGSETTTTDSSHHSSTTTEGTPAAATAGSKAEAVLTTVYPDTTVNGTARFEQLDNGKVKLVLDLEIPAKANRSVAVHIHEHGDCGDTAKHAGGHWNPTNVNHGKWGEGAYHSGDIGNIQLDGSGKGSFEVETDLWSLGGDAKTNILNRSVMVHGGVDDYKTQPSGNSGSRIGCGTITAK